MSRVLVTGAAGSIGTTLRAGLPPLGHQLRLLDRAQLPDVQPEEDVVIGDITDPATLDTALGGVDAVVHLAAIASEAPFADILQANIAGTEAVFAAARRAGVRRVVYASSNHAVGFTPRLPLAGVDLPPRPDTYYGVSKVFGEAVGRLYVDRYGFSVACLRIGSFLDRPVRRRHLATWLSPGDMTRLTHACLTAPDFGFAIVYGISANTRGWWDHEPGRALGYQPQDDAEVYAAEVTASADDDLGERFLGGEFTGPAYDA